MNCWRCFGKSPPMQPSDISQKLRPDHQLIANFFLTGFIPGFEGVDMDVEMSHDSSEGVDPAPWDSDINRGDALMSK